MRQNPNLGWETLGAFKGFPPTIDVNASMRDPTTTRSNGFTQLQVTRRPVRQWQISEMLLGRPGSLL